MTPDATPVPPRLPDYEFIRLVGRGAYGDVWLTRGVTGVFRAVKVVWRNRFNDAQPYEREFKGLKEFAAISLLETRQLALLHVGRDAAGGFFYYVMELADDAEKGREIDPATYVPNTLKEVRARRGHLPPPDALALAVELTRALAGLHTRGLVHRDIKPSNVILVGGVPKLADIGLVASTTAAHTFVGTEGYVPPEGPGAPSADVFSLGKLLYELTTGLDRHEYPRLPSDLHRLPERKLLLELNEIIIRACESDPARRYRDASALLDELLLLQAGRSVRRLHATERRLARALRVAAIFAVIATIAGIGAYVERRRANNELVLREKAEAERDDLARRRSYSGNLASAQRALEVEDFGRARRLLAEIAPSPGEPDLRGFEWHLLSHRARGDPHRTLRTGGAAIDRLVLTPDESRLAVQDTMDIVTLYDVATGELNRRIEGIRALAGFSSDGQWLIGEDTTHTLRRWSMNDGRPAPADSRIPSARPLVVSGPSQVVLLDDGPPPRLREWDLVQQREIASLELASSHDRAEPWAVFRTGTGVDGHTVAVALVRGSGSRAQFALAAAHFAPVLRAVHLEVGSTRPSAVGVDSQGPWAAFDTTGELWRCSPDGWFRSAETVPVATRRYVELGPPSPSRLAAHVRQLTWLNPGPPASTRVGRGHGALLSDVAISPRHQVVFSAAIDGSLFAWPIDGPVPAPASFQGWDFNAGASGLVFTRDSRRLWVPADGHSCVLLDLATGKIESRATDMLYPLAGTTGGLIGIGASGGLLQTDLDTGSARGPAMHPGARLRIAAVSSADGRAIAAIDHGGRLLTLPNGDPVQAGWDRFFVIALDEAGQTLWATDSGRSLVALEWPRGPVRWRRTLPAVAPHFLLLPGKRTLVLALENGSLELRDADTGESIRQIDSGSAAPQALALSPDGRRLFAGGLEGDIHCFDTSTWDEVHVLSLGRGQRLHLLACSSDGRTLAGLTKTGMLHWLRTD